MRQNTATVEKKRKDSKRAAERIHKKHGRGENSSA